MAKLTVYLAAALLVALLSIAEAATPLIHEDENQRGVTERCREQAQRQPLQHCMMYISPRSSSPFEGGEEQDEEAGSLRMVTNTHERHLKPCCNELRNLEEGCRCEAIRSTMRQLQSRGEIQGGEELHERLEQARYLPRICDLRPRQCQW